MRTPSRAHLAWILAAVLLLAPAAEVRAAPAGNRPDATPGRTAASQPAAIDASIARLWESLYHLWTAWAGDSAPLAEPSNGGIERPPGDRPEGPNNDPVG